MIPLIPTILSWSRRHRVAVVACAIGLAAFSTAGIRRLTFDTDVLSLLPRDGRVIPAFRTFVEHFGSLDDLYIVFTAPEGHAVTEYGDEIEGWVDRLRNAPEVTRVDTGLADRSRDLGWLADRQLLLLDGETLGRALDRLRGDGMRPAVAARRELLSLPSADVAALVRQDPLGLFDLLRDQLGDVQAGMNFGVTEGGFVTADGRSRLIIARPARPPYDTGFSRALMAVLERVRVDAAARPDTGEDALPPLDVEAAGGHRIAVETEQVVRRESIWNTVGSLSLILPLLFLVFRSAWLVGAGPVPSALALVTVLGVLGLAGATLSAAATASAAMLFGLGVDGVVLLYVAHTLALRGSPPHDEPHAPNHADPLSGPASSMLLGMWTTAATFYGLAFVDFPSLQALGLLIGHSMVLCGIFTLIVVPALLPRKAPARARRTLTLPRLASWVERRRTAIRIAAAFVTLVLGFSALNVRINPTLDRLRSVTPGAQLLERIGPRFGLPSEVYTILQRGPELEPLLAANERMAGAISRSLPSVRLQAASALLPAQDTQASRAATVRQAGLAPAGVAAALQSAAADEGFRRDSFAPFIERLPRLLAPGERLTFDGYARHGLGDLIGRFVAVADGEWMTVSYAFPSTGAEVAGLEAIVAGSGGDATLTGLPLVNRELAARFMPQFVKGLTIGTAVVLILMLAALRDWRLALLALLPAVLGLVWAAGLLALARIELDLFAVFAVVTFVGIGVDYGIHLVHRYRERGQARHAVEELAPVILVAAAITFLGYGTLVTSSYPPLRSIGVVSLVTVVTLAAASLLVLPAVLPARNGRMAPAPGQAGREAVP